MSSYCKDCGSVLSGGMCSNCQEELYILTYQSDYVDEVSPEFADKAKKQAEILRKRERDEFRG